MIKKLPIPQNDWREVTLRNASPAKIAEIKELSANKKYVDSVLTACEAFIQDMDGHKPSYNELKDLYWANAEFICVFGFALTGIATKLAHHSECPYCGKGNELSKDNKEDRRIDILDIPVNYFEESSEPVFVLNPYTEKQMRDAFPKLSIESESEYNSRIKNKLGYLKKIIKEKTEIEITSISFRFPKINDLFEPLRMAKNSKEFGEILKYKLIVDGEFSDNLDEDIPDFNHLVRKFRMASNGFLNFEEVPQYYDMIDDGIRSYGISPYLKVTCDNMGCRNEYDSPWSFHYFFDYALRLQASKKQV